MATTSTFSSSVDEELMKHIRDAQDLVGVTKKPEKAKGARVFDYPEGFKPLDAVIPLARCALKIPMRVFSDTDWPEHLRPFIPEPDPNYVFDPEATLAVAVALMHGDKALLHGPKGSGKTTLPQQICARIRMPYIRVNCRVDMESSALFGSVKYDPAHGMVWVDGPVPELARHGGCICVDEVSRMPAGIAASMMAVLERNGAVYLADKPAASADKFIKPHEWFRIVCTDNTELQGDTTGKYVGTNVQDEAMIDRFSTTIKLGYLAPSHEVAVITGKVNAIDNRMAHQMVSLAGLIRSSYDSGNIGFTMSPRGLIEWAEKIAFWDDMRTAFKLAFWNKLTPTDQQVVSEFYHTVFAENLR